MCDLTHAGDKLVALAGLAKSFAPLIAEGYYCGIWGGRGLLRSLLWVCHERFDGRRPPAPMEYRAPSWSWASCDGRIGPNMTFSITTTVVEVESTHVLPKIAAAFLEHGFVDHKHGFVNHKHGFVDHRDGVNLSRPTYFLPFCGVSSRDISADVEYFVGLWVQPAEESSAPNREYVRIGYGSTEYAKYKAKRFLGDGRWGTLLKLRSRETLRDRIVPT